MHMHTGRRRTRTYNNGRTDRHIDVYAGFRTIPHAEESRYTSQHQHFYNMFFHNVKEITGIRKQKRSSLPVLCRLLRFFMIFYQRRRRNRPATA